MEPLTLVLGAIVAIVGVPAVLTAIGFTSGGIAAGSLAALLMSLSAVARGGAVAAGGAVAVLQSIGAAGFTVGGKIVLGAIGAVAAAVIANLL